MSAAANRYAKALIDALYPEKAERGYEQLQSFSALLAEQPETRLFFENPTIPSDRRKSLVKEIADATGLSVEIRNFVDILIERNRLALLDEIIQAYQRRLDDKLGIVRAVVTAARPLDAADESDLIGSLERLTGKEVRMDVLVDPELIGGVIAKVGSTIYDGSLRQQLKNFKTRVVQE